MATAVSKLLARRVQGRLSISITQTLIHSVNFLLHEKLENFQKDLSLLGDDSLAEAWTNLLAGLVHDLLPTGCSSCG